MGRKFGLSATERDRLNDVVIEIEVREELQAGIRAQRDEGCAALYGHEEDGSLSIDECRWLLNRVAGPACFTVSVNELLYGSPAGPAPESDGANTTPPLHRGSRLVGLFHSHPNGSALLSDTDSMSISHLPFVWAIAGFMDHVPELRCFAWSAQGTREIQCR